MKILKLQLLNGSTVAHSGRTMKITEQDYSRFILPANLIKANLHNYFHADKQMLNGHHRYLYIYICVCVCVCVCMLFVFSSSHETRT